MSRASQRLSFIALVLLAVAGIVFAASRLRLGHSSLTSSLHHPAADPPVEAQLRSTSDGVPELWLVGVDGSAVKVSRLEAGEAVADNFTWSPNSSLLAFESYSLGGHSPLTTSHVWVVQRNGKGLVRVSLPRPNERLSTYVDEWVDDNTLKIRATLSPSKEDVHYTFAYDKQAVQPISDDKPH